jgi:hypothetical protein
MITDEETPDPHQRLSAEFTQNKRAFMHQEKGSGENGAKISPQMYGTAVLKRHV